MHNETASAETVALNIPAAMTTTVVDALKAGAQTKALQRSRRRTWFYAGIAFGALTVTVGALLLLKQRTAAMAVAQAAIGA